MSSVAEVVTELELLDIAVLSRAEVQAAYGGTRQVRGWVDALEGRLARRLNMIAESNGAILPEADIAEASRTTRSEAGKATRRAKTLGEVPQLEDALAAGDVSTEHVDAVTRASRRLKPEDRAKLTGDGDRLAEIAARSTPEEFETHLKGEIEKIDSREGGERLLRQKRAIRLRSWTDKDSGMVLVRAELDPETGMLVLSRIDKTADTLFHDKTPDDCPTDPEQKHDYLRAAAFTRLILRRKKPATNDTNDTNDTDDGTESDAETGTGDSFDAADAGEDFDNDDTGAAIDDAGAATDDFDAADLRDAFDDGDTDAGSDGDDDSNHELNPTTGSPVQPDLFGDDTSADEPATTAADSADPAVNAGRAVTAAAGKPQLDPRYMRPADSGRDPDNLTGLEITDYDNTCDMIVVIDWLTLTNGLHEHSIIDNGTPHDLPIETYRRMACTAAIIPVVLNSDGVCLDLGRDVRVANRAQRRALAAMYKTCAIPDCTVSSRHCQPHHVDWWTRLGPTDLGNLLPLCSRHHHAVHEGGWQLVIHPNRSLTITYPNGQIQQTGPPASYQRQRPQPKPTARTNGKPRPPTPPPQPQRTGRTAA